MNVAPPKIEILHKYGRRDVIANVQPFESGLVFHGILHSHRFHPALDFLAINLRDVPFRIERDDYAIELVFSIGAFDTGLEAFSLQAHSASASSNMERDLCGIFFYYCWPAPWRSRKRR